MIRTAITIDDLFAHALVINRDCDMGRMELMRLSFGRENLPMPRRIGAVELRALAGRRERERTQWQQRTDYHPANCSASHIQCVHLAQTLGWPCVMVFEDDAWPQRGCRAALEKTLRGVPGDCGVLRMGVHNPVPGKVFKSINEAREKNNAQSHATLYFADAFQTYLDAYRAECAMYHADMIFAFYPPLTAVTQYAPGLFCQCNEGGGPLGLDKYSSFGGNSLFLPDPPDGFPTIAEVRGAAASAEGGAA